MTFFLDLKDGQKINLNTKLSNSGATNLM